MATFQRHPLSAAFASMADTDLGALTADIEQFGQRESGLLLDGMILDGWHRYQATLSLGVDFNALEFSDEYPDLDPVAFVISKNLHRRHLTKEQRAAAVVACRQWATVGNPNLATVARLPTNRDLAQEADVSERTISRAKVAHEAGLGGAVIAGEMTLRQAESAVKAQRAPTKTVIGLQNIAADAAQPTLSPASVPTIREQKKGGEHEGASEVAARTDAVATRPSLRANAAEESSPAKPTALEIVAAERDGALERVEDLQDELRISVAELEAYRAAEIGDGEKKLIAANKRALQLEGEIRRLEARRDALMNENAELKREVKSLRKRLGLKANG
jgi:hypothetical protein